MDLTPEQRDLDERDFRIDVYSFGVYPNRQCSVRVTHIPTGIVESVEVGGEIPGEWSARVEARRRIAERIVELSR